MTYIVVTKEIDTNSQYSFADFDKEEFETKQNIKLHDNPISVTIQDNNLVLIFQEKKEKEKTPRSFSFSG